jgi:hypothetical protein
MFDLQVIRALNDDVVEAYNWNRDSQVISLRETLADSAAFCDHVEFRRSRRDDELVQWMRDHGCNV